MPGEWLSRYDNLILDITRSDLVCARDCSLIIIFNTIACISIAISLASFFYYYVRSCGSVTIRVGIIVTFFWAFYHTERNVFLY